MHIIESGNVAAALGVKLAGAQVIAAYPITPQTPLTEKLSEFVDAGEMKRNTFPLKASTAPWPFALQPRVPVPGLLRGPVPMDCFT